MFIEVVDNKAQESNLRADQVIEVWADKDKVSVADKLGRFFTVVAIPQRDLATGEWLRNQYPTSKEVQDYVKHIVYTAYHT